jgi:hypothetical protein
MMAMFRICCITIYSSPNHRGREVSIFRAKGQVMFWLGLRPGGVRDCGRAALHSISASARAQPAMAVMAGIGAVERGSVRVVAVATARFDDRGHQCGDSPARTRHECVGAQAEGRPVDNLFEAQLALARMGLSPGSLDGVMGSRTRNALRMFQQREQLRAER